MMTYSQLVRAGKGAVGTVKVALDLFSDNVVEHYLDAFTRIRQKGYYESVMEVYGNFVDDLQPLFQPSSVTTTEKVLRFGWLRRLWRWLWLWRKRNEPSAVSEQPSAVSEQSSAVSEQPSGVSDQVSEVTLEGEPPER